MWGVFFSQPHAKMGEDHTLGGPCTHLCCTSTTTSPWSIKSPDEALGGPGRAWTRQGGSVHSGWWPGASPAFHSRRASSHHARVSAEPGHRGEEDTPPRGMHGVAGSRHQGNKGHSLPRVQRSPPHFKAQLQHTCRGWSLRQGSGKRPLPRGGVSKVTSATLVVTLLPGPSLTSLSPHHL